MTFLNLNSNVYFCYSLQLWILHDFPEYKQQCLFLLFPTTMDINMTFLNLNSNFISVILFNYGYYMTFLNLNSNVYFCYSLWLFLFIGTVYIGLYGVISEGGG
jgi:hypothetical protein